MKLYKKIIIVILLMLVFAYVCNITLLPSSYIIMQGENLNIFTLLGLYIKPKVNYQTMQTASNINKTKVNELGKIDFDLSFFNIFKLKEINVNVISKTKVIPMGNAIGMKLYTDGVLVVGMSEIEGKKPYENSGIKEGDRIVQIDKKAIDNTEDLMEAVNKCSGKEISVKYIRDNTTITTSIKPIKNSGNQYKIGLWVRDAAAGVGTLTFYEPSSGMFGTLGHGILDVDTSELIKIANGELVTTNILNITKGKKGDPGEIRGTIENGYNIGTINKNTSLGVYGSVTNKNYLDTSGYGEMEVATRSEIQDGKAQIICQLDNSGKKTYEIEIEKIYLANNTDNKSMLIKVTDKELLEKTGGIIQGMSGAPVIQNGKFIGAVTNVLVNDPTQGYAIFADMMIKQIRSVD